MPSLVEIAETVHHSNLPVLIVDTCSIIDVARGPARLRANELVDLGTIVEAIESTPHGCEVVLCSIVPKEIIDNIGTGTGTLRKYLEDAEVANGLIKKSMGFFQIAGTIEAIPVDEICTHHADMAQRLIGSALVLDTHQDSQDRAFHRAIYHLKPASQGGTVKDSIIFEESLELSRQLRTLGHASPRVFLSSNTADFYESGRLAANVEVDCNDTDLVFTTNWSWAKSKLGL